MLGVRGNQGTYPGYLGLVTKDRGWFSGVWGVAWVQGAVGLLHSPLLKIRCPHRLEFFDLLLGVGQMVDRFPGRVVKRVSFPFDEVLWRLSHDSLVQDDFNLIFFFVVRRDNGWWRRRASEFFGRWLVQLK